MNSHFKICVVLGAVAVFPACATTESQTQPEATAAAPVAAPAPVALLH